MKDGLDITLVTSGSLIKKGYSYLVANVGKTVALITLAITALVSFTEISFSDLGSKTFTSTLITMLIASYIMYFSLEDAGERLGREGDEYRSAEESYTALRDKVKGCDIRELRRFCLDYRDAELDYRRKNLLFSLGYSEEEYKDYSDGKKVSKRMAKALGRVKKLKPAELNTTSLLTLERTKKEELRNPEAYRITRMLIRLIPSTVCMLFTVSIMISLKDNMTAAGIIEALIKLATLPIIGLKGYAGGYEYATVDEIGWLRTKARLLESFLYSYKKAD